MSEPLRLIWFAPDAGNWVYFAMEHAMADALAASGHEVTVVQCDGILNSYCPVMTARGLPAQAPSASKSDACRDCQQAARIARHAGRYRTVQLSSFLSREVIADVDGMVASTTQANWEELEVDGIPVGRHSAYTTLLHHKTATITDTDAAWAEYQADLRNALLVARAMPPLLESTMPTHGVVYNALYPANRAFAEVVLRRGLPLLNLSGGPTVPRRYSTLALYDGLKASQTATDSSAFAESMSVPCSAQEVAVVEQHLLSLMAGSDPWVYSTAATARPAHAIRRQLGLRAESPVATVIVSSPDETRASMLVDAEFMRAPERGYASAAEFLAESLALARATPDVDFVFRMHPRMAPNKRESVRSPDLAAMDALLVDLPANAVVNYPADGLSLYDLVTISSVAVNHTSSAGLEFLMFGIPAVQYDPARAGMYPLDFAYPVERHDIGGFEHALREALNSGWSLERSIRVFRWLASWQVRALVHVDPLPEAAGSSGPRAEAAPQQASRLGRLLPGRVKERIALELEGRRRSAELAGRTLDAGMVEAFTRHAMAASVDREVWEPPMMLPPQSDESTERAAVAAAVERLRSRLALADLRGLGVVRDGQSV